MARNKPTAPLDFKAVLYHALEFFLLLLSLKIVILTWVLGELEAAIKKGSVTDE